MLTPAKLLKKHVGRTVRVVKTNPATAPRPSRIGSPRQLGRFERLGHADQSDWHHVTECKAVVGRRRRDSREEEFRHLAALQAKTESTQAPSSPMAQESLFEYHLCILNHPTMLADNQTKQVALLNAAAVPVWKELLLSGGDYYYRQSVGDIGQEMKTAVYVEFTNRVSAYLS